MGDIVPVQPGAVTAGRASLSDLVEDSLATLDVAESSRATYGRQLRQFVSWLQETGRAGRPASLTREDILEYKDYLKKQGRSSHTVGGYLVAVRKFFEWLEASKIYPNVARGVKGAKRPKGFRKDTLTAGQLRDILASFDRATQAGLRDYALVNLMARTGLRDVEVARAKVEDIRQEAGEAVLYIQGKGRDSKDEFVLLVEEALKPLRQYLSSRGPLPDEAPLFSSLSNRNSSQGLTTRSISRIVKQALRRSGLDSSRLSAHSLRHTAVTLALKGGATLQQAQAMARHSDPRTTMIYAHNLDRIQAGAEKHISF